MKMESDLRKEIGFLAYGSGSKSKVLLENRKRLEICSRKMEYFRSAESA